ncbi:MAG: tyrosine-protein kinase [Acidimicrobiia bacterium]|nr:tyrosine-protein kinase [Acidimicrobiia bacterium]
MNGPTAVQAIRKGWPLVAGLALVGAVAAFALSFLIPQKYSTSVQVFVTLGPQRADVDPFGGSQFVLQRMEGYAELATSPEVLNAVTSELALGQTPQELAGQITSINPPNTVLVDLTVEDRTAQGAAIIADNLVVQLRRSIDAIERDNGPAKSSPVQVTALGPAALPPNPSGPNHVLYALAGLCIGILAGVGVPLARGRNKIRAAATAERQVPDAAVDATAGNHNGAAGDAARTNATPLEMRRP